jgi:hypothetical protein
VSAAGMADTHWPKTARVIVCKKSGDARNKQKKVRLTRCLYVRLESAACGTDAASLRVSHSTPRLVIPPR